MIPRPPALKKASFPVTIKIPIVKDSKRSLVTKPDHGSPISVIPKSSGRTKKSIISKSPFAPFSGAQIQNSTQERDFLVSVLETSVTKRDARAYMNKFVPLLQRKGATSFKQQASQSRSSEAAASAEPPQIAQHESARTLGGADQDTELPALEPLYVALVKFRDPQHVDDDTMLGLGKTLSQLRKLGLISIVVVDCDIAFENEAEQRRVATAQANRIQVAIDSYDAPGARIIESPITIGDSIGQDTSPFTSQDLFVTNSKDLMNTLQSELIPIIPTFGYNEEHSALVSVDPNDAVIALTRQLSGLQFFGQPSEDAADAQVTRLLRSAEVYRLIVLDPVGGIPAQNRATGRYMFLNLEQEYEEVTKHLASSNTLDPSANVPPGETSHHLKNAELARKVLSLLPPTSSAVITTPQEAATRSHDADLDWALVGTRRKLNPLIHNLLTDRPVKSSSLPSGRFRPVVSGEGDEPRIGSLTTLAKRGMPLTIFPDPREAPWRPPQPGESCLRLTDPCIDLGRLVNLINDSFGRTLDVDHYLKRVNDSLAGIIIAGEYEGGAILTWESPYGNSGPERVETSRMVPYLDKFAVLRKSQGAGGVADIVFNAMVRDCFPEGVCWRSRKDNPVNKWYFERSRGTMKIRDMNWTMFWTTPDLAIDQQTYRDYESVCRGVQPSWADNKQILD